MDVVQKIDEMILFLTETVKKDAIRFQEKQIKTSGTRVRKAMQDLKKTASEVRAFVREAKSEMTPDPERSAKAKERSPFAKTSPAIKKLKKTSKKIEAVQE